MRKYFYDTEFIDDGSTIDLISIAVVDETGREYYAVSSQFDVVAAMRHDWLPYNVLPYLPQVSGEKKFELNRSHPDVKSRSRISYDLEEFFLADGMGRDRDARLLWAWYSAYDHVALAQLWGPMVALPEFIPMHTMDLKHEHVLQGRPELPAQDLKEHHALEDARHNVVIARALGVL